LYKRWQFSHFAQKVSLLTLNFYKMSGIILPFKNLLLRVGGFMLMLFCAFSSMAQTAENVGIGTTKPDASAILDLTSNSKGFLVPRMTLAQRGNIKSPANGLLVYQTDFFSGFYFFDGASWKGLYARSADGAVITPSTTTPAASATAENAWNIGGNSGLNGDVNFIGTLDTTSLVFKVNNYRSGLIDYRFGNTYFGYRAGYRSHGFNSVAIGAYALHDANLGLNNIAIGYQSLPSTKTGSDNIALGSSALYSNSTGSQNIAIGTQAGQRSVGDGNIFLGHHAGVDETGDNKLYIESQIADFPLIFGNFATARVGINTKEPGSTLSIDSKAPNTSGLEFKQLNANSPAGRPNQKVLSLDDKGRVILVRDSIGLGSGVPLTIPPSYWTLKGSSIENNNAGDVLVSNIRFKNLRTISPAIKSNTKVLTVDDNGLIVLAQDSIGSIGASTPNHWSLNGSNISNNNAGKLILNGGIQLGNIKASNKAFNSYGKVLTVDDSGNLVLVRDSVGTSSIPISLPSSWNLAGNNLSNTNIGFVNVNNGLILSNLSSENATSVVTKKFLTVDNTGKVILATTPESNVVAPESQWTLSGTNISNANAGVVSINNGLRAKKGIYLESGVLEVNSAIENKSGLQFSQLKSSNPTEKSNGKVLSVDANGQVILVKDSVGVAQTIPVSSPSPWTITDNAIGNNNSGKVRINNGLVLGQITSETSTTINSQKFLTVDNAGNVILGNVANVSAPTSSYWAANGDNVINVNSGRVVVGNGLSTKNGLVIESGNLEAGGNLILHNLKFSSIASKSSGKVLSVDDNGKVILVKDSVGTTAAPVASSWNTNGNDIANSNLGSVTVKNSLILSKFNVNDSTISVTAKKVLSLDAYGNVILANLPPASKETTVVTTSSDLWKDNGNGGITNNSPLGITINSGVDGKSGLQLLNLKASSAVTLAAGKVLSVDDNGNVVLVYDYAGNTSSSSSNEWKTIDGRSHSINNKVVIGTGINSFPDGFQLFVKGGILTERVRVAVANSDRWADYVFKKGYKLMPLRDVERFIKYNQHLPNVPSAQEMAKNGLDVMETSAKLMEKIEELTLYMIEANKKIEVLEAKMKAVENNKK
jgi:trimeric autotransporter adhesin